MVDWLVGVGGWLTGWLVLVVGGLLTGWWFVDWVVG